MTTAPPGFCGPPLPTGGGVGAAIVEGRRSGAFIDSPRTGHLT